MSANLPPVEASLVDHVLELTINRPDARNALDANVGSALTTNLARADSDTEVLVVLLTGSGDKSFCAGMDLKAFAAGADLSRVGTALEALRNCSKPVVAAVNGAALAGGFELLMLCDLVVAADHAVFGIPEVKRGLLAAGGATRLPARIPIAIALELGLTGDAIDAKTAAHWGLVNSVVDGAVLLDTARELAARIAANAPLAVQATKRLMVDELGCGDPEAVRTQAGRLFRTADAVEGARAFAERRPAQWLGQ